MLVNKNSNQLLHLKITMHHALKVHEIIQEVCEYIELSRTCYSLPKECLPKNQWMTSIALVCCAWFEPAIDVKWATLRDLTPFTGIWVARGVLEKKRGTRYVRALLDSMA